MALEKELIPVNTMGVKDEETGKWIPVDAVGLRSFDTRFTADDIHNKFSDTDYKIGNIEEIKSKGASLSEKIINEFNYRGVNITWLGAKGDGLTDDSFVFESIESEYKNKTYDLSGKTFVVSAFPRNNRYINGYFKINDKLYFSGYEAVIQSGNSNVIIGRNAAGNFRPSDQYQGLAGHNLIAIGDNAMYSASENSKNSIALGLSALGSNEYGFYNIAIGLKSQANSNGVKGQKFTGTRNTSVGDQTLHFNKDGYSNVAIGRNALQTNEHSNWNVALGAGAMSGYAPLDMDGVTIVNNTPQSFVCSTAVGVNTLPVSNGNDNTAVGANAGKELKKGDRNTAIGAYALETLEKNVSFEGTDKTFREIYGTFEWKESDITVHMPKHDLQIGYKALLSFNNKEAIYFTIAETTIDTFKVISNFKTADPVSGTVLMTEFSSNTEIPKSLDNTAVGIKSMYLASRGNYNTGLGGFSLANNAGDRNTAVGYLALASNTKGINNTAVGYGALRFMTGGGELENVSNSTGIGYNSRVSGSNQIQLGNGEVTPYSYSPLQNRSDLRDKADIRDTILGLDFIKKIRPVDYKWDIRDEYITIDEENNAIVYEKDGSKKKNRYHHGVIAQDIQGIIQQTGIDFGGFQHHQVNGGEDVMSIGYTEFIAPLIKAVQELSSKVDKQEEEIQKLKVALDN
ncbi:tail fiber domain-containing protein [Priestia sp. WB3]